MKLIGAAFIILGCVGVGFYAAISHKRVLSDLKKLEHLLSIMSCELQYKLTPLPVLLRETCNNVNGYIKSLFLALANELDSQINPDVQSCAAVVLGNYPSIPKDVLSCLTALFETLGRFDLKGQLEGLSYAHQMCREKICAMEDNKDERLRVYQTLGLCAGVALAVLMI